MVVGGQDDAEHARRGRRARAIGWRGQTTPRHQASLGRRDEPDRDGGNGGGGDGGDRGHPPSWRIAGYRYPVTGGSRATATRSRVDVPGARLVHESAFRAPHRQARDRGREAVERAREVAVIPHAYDDEHPRCLELVHSSQPLKGSRASTGCFPPPT